MVNSFQQLLEFSEEREYHKESNRQQASDEEDEDEKEEEENGRGSDGPSFHFSQKEGRRKRRREEGLTIPTTVLQEMEEIYADGFSFLLCVLDRKLSSNRGDESEGENESHKDTEKEELKKRKEEKRNGKHRKRGKGRRSPKHQSEEKKFLGVFSGHKSDGELLEDRWEKPVTSAEEECYRENCTKQDSVGDAWPGSLGERETFGEGESEAEEGHEEFRIIKSIEKAIEEKIKIEIDKKKSSQIEEENRIERHESDHDGAILWTPPLSPIRSPYLTPTMSPSFNLELVNMERELNEQEEKSIGTPIHRFPTPF